MEGHDWQVLNELDSGRGQGWGGTLEDYLLFTQYTNDAIQTVYNLPALQGKTFRLYAPVAKSMNTWVAESLRLNATMIDRIDWHNYSTSHYDNAVQARAWSAQYSPSAGSDNPRLSLGECPEWVVIDRWSAENPVRNCVLRCYGALSLRDACPKGFCPREGSYRCYQTQC